MPGAAHKDVRYYTDGRHLIRVYISPTVTQRDKAWDDAVFEKHSKVDGWVVSQTARLDIEYDGDWVECPPPARPKAEWWNEHRSEQRKERERARSQVGQSN